MNKNERENIIEDILSVKAGQDNAGRGDLDIEEEIERMKDMSEEKLKAIWQGWYYEWCASRNDFEEEDAEYLYKKSKGGDRQYHFTAAETVEVSL